MVKAVKEEGGLVSEPDRGTADQPSPPLRAHFVAPYPPFPTRAIKRSGFAVLAFFVYSPLISCAHSTKAIAHNAPISVEAVSIVREENENSHPEQPQTPMDAAFSLAESNRLQKYFTADKDDIAVYSDISIDNKNFKVHYDLRNAELSQEARSGSYFRVPFSVEDRGTKEKRTGTLHWDINALEKDGSGLLLSFDDDYYEEWERYFDLFDRYGARITFFVLGKPLAFCKRALARGHDVGYHTIRHLNLPKAPRETFDQETVSEISAFHKAGIPLQSFAYPFGLSEPWMHTALSSSFKILRGYGVTFRVYDAASIKKGYIAAKAIDNIVYKNDEDFTTIITVMLRTIKFIGNGSVLPLCTHSIAQSADWGISPARLEYLLKTARDLRLQFYVYQDFIDSF
jgi:peptidoglycan/xylan/chitin deacetylase (PgdA/CDA1 family)